MSARPVVTVQNKEGETMPLPAVFLAPIRPDLVNNVHTALRRNKRQPYAVKKTAGEQTSAESWGTGRAVSRIPRVPGGGTHRAGQGAFGNMCRGGRMFAPTKIWRKWHMKANLHEKRYAVVSAIAASAVPALVLARGHAIEEVPEVPLVIDTADVAEIEKTKNALAILGAVHALDDVEKAKDSHHLRRGTGKMRGRRYTMRRGPLVVHDNEGKVAHGMRNIAGVEVASVDSLNLLQLAPGGHIGRFVVWTKAAFAKLDAIFGSTTEFSQVKKGFKLPVPKMTNPDLGRIINSPEIQSALRAKKEGSHARRQRHNPLTNWTAMVRLNPYAPAARRIAILTQKDNLKNKEARKTAHAKRRARMAALKKAGSARTMLDTMTNDYEPKAPKEVAEKI